MPVQRVLITGGSGLLALNWACCMRDRCEVILAEHKHKVALRGTRSVPLGLEPISALTASLTQLRPDLIVHTAGLTRVDQCEQQPALAQHLNAELARNVAHTASRLGIKLVHISTDHLFPGTRPLYTESDPPAPLNEYARSKWRAEQLVSEECPAAITVRTNFFGWGHRHRQSLSDWILAALRSGRAIPMFDDVFFTPILVDRLALMLHQLVSQEVSGLYHLGGDERLSKYEFALRLARAFDVPDGLVKRASISSSASPVERPLDMSLDNGRARGLLGSAVGGVDEFLSTLREQERTGRAHELINSVSE